VQKAQWQNISVQVNFVSSINKGERQPFGGQAFLLMYFAYKYQWVSWYSWIELMIMGFLESY
jgi:hypothetical protein